MLKSRPNNAINIVDNGGTMAGARCKILGGSQALLPPTRVVDLLYRRARLVRGVWTNTPSIFCNKIVVEIPF